MSRSDLLEHVSRVPKSEISELNKKYDKLYADPEYVDESDGFFDEHGQINPGILKLTDPSEPGGPRGDQEKRLKMKYASEGRN